MLDLGFLPDVERILKLTPETRQTMLFSATMPAAIVSLARTHMRHPMNIRAESSYDTQLVPATAQFIYQAHDLDKPEIIGRILQAEDADKIIVFTRTKRQSQRIADDLAERGFSASPLHGDMAQVAREKALTKFREDKIRVLVATDVAARGIDVAGRLPRHQLHLPRGREDLHPPDRPHRPRRRLRHRRHLRRLGGPGPLEDDQQGARPAVRGARRRPTPPPSTSTTTSASRPAPRAGSSTPPRSSASRAPTGPDRGERPATRTERPSAQPQPHADPQWRHDRGRPGGRGSGARRRGQAVGATGAAVVAVVRRPSRPPSPPDRIG